MDHMKSGKNEDQWNVDRMKNGKNEDEWNELMKARAKALRATMVVHEILGTKPDHYTLSEFEKLDKNEQKNSDPDGAD